MVEQQAITHDRTRQGILVVDDVLDSRLMLKLRLQREGYTVDEANNGRMALEFIQQKGVPHLVILDVLMPDIDGFAVAEKIHHLYEIPIIFLSAVSDTNTKVKALKYYAEDYITKPFAFAELLARVQRVLRSRLSAKPREIESLIDEHIRINFALNYVIVDQTQIMLTPTETRLMQLLYTYRGCILSRDFLLTNVWESIHTCTSKTLGMHVGRLRSKIEPDPDHPRYIITILGQGYCLPHLHQADMVPNLP